jgi:hypothetical protein
LELRERCSKILIFLHYNSIVLELHGVLELGCLATNLFGVGGVLLHSHAKQALNGAEGISYRLADQAGTKLRDVILARATSWY